MFKLIFSVASLTAIGLSLAELYVAAWGILSASIAHTPGWSHRTAVVDSRGVSAA